MSRLGHLANFVYQSFPRMRGDEPNADGGSIFGNGFSPHARG